jgi:F0F1-type ATP synthase assembly protein I
MLDWLFGTPWLSPIGWILVGGFLNESYRRGDPWLGIIVLALVILAALVAILRSKDDVYFVED